MPVAALLVIGSAALAGCGDTGGLKSAGPTPTAAGPRTLWPTLPPARTRRCIEVMPDCAGVAEAGGASLLNCVVIIPKIY